MNTPESLTNYQKNFLIDLYKKKSPITKRELQSQPEKYNLSEIYSLIDANSNLICIRGKNTFNESVEITCEGRAVVEAIRKQNSDEMYKRNLDRESIEIAKEANTIAQEANTIAGKANKKADKSNLIAIIAAILAGVSIVADIFLAIFA